MMIVKNAGYDASFARVPQNKLEFSAREWNPMNQIILCFPEVIGMISNKDR